MSETLVIFYMRDAIIFGYSVNPTIGYALFASVNCKQLFQPVAKLDNVHVVQVDPIKSRDQCCAAFK